MPAPYQLTGKKFKKWTVIRQKTKPRAASKGTFWECRCDCGTIKLVRGADLVQKRSKQCSLCAHKERSKRTREWVHRNQGNYFCHCGCGQPIKIQNHHYYRGVSKFINGHSAKVANPMAGMVGRKNPNFKSGKHKNKAGYVMVLIPGPGRSKYILEHRLVMEKHLKRKLKKNEVVHHINQVRTDNRVSNLQVMDEREHLKHHAKLGQIGFAFHKKWKPARRSA